MFPFAAPAIIRPSVAILKPQYVVAIDLWTGDDNEKTIVNGVDLLGRRGAVLSKARDAGQDWYLTDTQRGVTRVLITNSPEKEYTGGGSVGVVQFNNNGYRHDAIAAPYKRVGYSFALGAKFFDANIFTHTNGTPTSIDLSSLGIVGDTVVKRLDAASDWYAWHRSLAAGNNLRLNKTAAQSATDAFISVSGTTLTFSASAPSGTYTYEAFAHDPSADGIVQCGGATTDAGGNCYVALPWYAQAVILKGISQSSNWLMADTTRGANFSSAAILRLNTPGVETRESDLLNIPQSGNKGFYLQDTGAFLPGSASFVYRAIRAPY